MCPPSRSVGRSGSSRLTRPPACTSPSDERRSVSRMTSAPKRSPQMPVAVRQTPFTATESPSATSRASGVSKVSRAPSAVVSTAATVPRSWTRPVNTARSELLQPGRDQHVVLDRLALQRQRADRVADALRALALERVAAPPADEQRRQEQPHL